MPHIRSAESKKRAAAVKRETKWLEILQAALPTLCRTLHETYSKTPGFRFIDVYSQTKRFGDTKCHVVRPNGLVLPPRRLEDFLPSEYSIDCYVRTDGGGFRVTFPFHALERWGIDFDMDMIEIWSNTTFQGRIIRPAEWSPLRILVYDWIQTTLHSELCRRRSERIREELVAAVWHPRRVARRLEEGGWEAVEAFA